MFSLRRFIATLLIIAVFSVGLGLLPSPLIQNATAISCDHAMDQCDLYWAASDLACRVFGESSNACIVSRYEAYLGCMYLLAICEG